MSRMMALVGWFFVVLYRIPYTFAFGMVGGAGPGELELAGVLVGPAGFGGQAANHCRTWTGEGGGV
jgi:hypothetical protein